MQKKHVPSCQPKTRELSGAKNTSIIHNNLYILSKYFLQVLENRLFYRHPLRILDACKRLFKLFQRAFFYWPKAAVIIELRLAQLFVFVVYVMDYVCIAAKEHNLAKFASVLDPYPQACKFPASFSLHMLNQEFYQGA